MNAAVVNYQNEQSARNISLGQYGVFVSVFSIMDEDKAEVFDKSTDVN